MNNFEKKKIKLEIEKWSIEMSSLYNMTFTKRDIDNSINKVNEILSQLRNLEKKRILNKKLNKIK